MVRREVHIIGDSKVKHLKQASSRRDEIEIKFHSYVGIITSDRKIIRKATSVSRTSYDPIILICLETCELTNKPNYLSLKDVDLELIIQNHINLKSLITNLSPHVTVIFLDCPYYSLAKFNQDQGSFIQSDIRDQKLLEGKIIEYNREIRNLNHWESPQLSQDLVSSCKKKGQQQKYSKNYYLQTDFIYSRPEPQKLWLFRVFKLIRKIVTDQRMC